MGLTAEVALTQLELLALGGPGLPDRDAIRAEAVGTLEGLGVGPLLGRLASLVARDAGTEPPTLVVATPPANG
jgi:hypothetical protein